LGKESGADGGFFIGLEVVVHESEDEGGLSSANKSAYDKDLVGRDEERTFPTAASPRRTNLTLLLGLGVAAAVESAMEGEDARLARRLRPTWYSDTFAVAC
jgi:hypothetical protein